MKNVKLLLWSIGTILIIISTVIIHIYIPKVDSNIESKDFEIYKLDDKIDGLDYQILSANNVKYVEISNANNAIIILLNLPHTESINYSIQILVDSKFDYYAQMILPLMEANEENIEDFISNTDLENHTVYVDELSDHLESIGEKNTHELFMNQLKKLNNKRLNLKTGKEELNKEKDELINEKKNILDLSSLFQVGGLIFIFLGELIKDVNILKESKQQINNHEHQL